MKTGLRRLGRRVGGLALTAVITATLAGSVYANDSITLSKFNNFAANNRFYSTADTLFMRVVTEDLDVTGIETASFTMTPRGEGDLVTGTLENHLDGSFTASLPLEDLNGHTRVWVVSVALADDDGHEFHADGDILITGLMNHPEVFELHGELEEVSPTQIKVAGQILQVDRGTQVFAGIGLHVRPGDLQVGQDVTVMVHEGLDGSLRAVTISLQGTGGGTLKIQGAIEARTDTSIDVDGVTLIVDSQTEIRGDHDTMATFDDLQIGVQVKARAWLRGDTAWVATEIRIRGNDESEDSEGELAGSVEEIGADYLVIAGIRVEVGVDTRFEGFAGLADLVVGMRVKIEFDVLADGTLLATKIESDGKEGDDDEHHDGHHDTKVGVHGTITEVTDTTIEVGGVVYLFSDATVILGEDHHMLTRADLYSGLVVEIEGVRQADGTLVALRIKVEDELTTEVETKGFITDLTETSLEVGGLLIEVTPDTRIKGRHGEQLTFADLEIGMFVEVKARMELDSKLVAVKIEVDDRFDREEVEVTAPIESIAADQIVVGGVTFQVDANTVVTDRKGAPIDYTSLQVGMVVKVEGRLQADGSVLARKIRLRNSVHAEGEVEGSITSLVGNDLEVAGIHFQIGTQTIFRGGISIDDLEIGQWVEVRFRLLSDGTRLALRIKVRNNPGSETELTGSITAVDAASITVADVVVEVNASTQILSAEGNAITLADLSVGQSVKVQATLEGGVLVASLIKVRSTEVIAAAIATATGSSISVAGRDVALDPETLIVGRNNVFLSTGDLQPGAYVEVIVLSTASGQLNKVSGEAAVAERVEVKSEQTLTGVGSSPGTTVPSLFTLRQNYPNPFNPSTTIRFVLETPSRVTLRIYNLLGQEMRTLVSAPFSSGSYQVQWDGRDNTGLPVASGIYIYRMTAVGQTQSRRMVLTR